MDLAVPVDRRNRLDTIPGLAAVRARIHGQRAADGPGNTREEFRRTEPPADALLRELRARHSGARPYGESVLLLERAKDLGCRDNDAAQTALAHQQIAAHTEPEDRRVFVELPQELLQVLDARRHEVIVRRPADAPRGVPAHRFVLTEIALHGNGFRCGHHECTFNVGLLPRRSGSVCA